LVIACGHARTPGEYREPISMSGDEAAFVDESEARSKALPNSFHQRCEFWDGQRARLTETMAGARRYVDERVKMECQNDPAYAFKGTAAQRDAAFAKATAGYEAVGAPSTLESGVMMKLPMDRGRCYVATLQFADGFAPTTLFYIEHKHDVAAAGAPVEFSGFKKGPGPGATHDLGCVYVSQQGTLLLKTDPGTKGELRVYAKTLSEEETRRREAEDASHWRAAAREGAVAKARQGREHCERCIDDLEHCIGEVFRGRTPIQGPCLDSYLSCLGEDRGDGVVTAQQCSEVAAGR
jgi:hypothetical protein